MSTEAAVRHRPIRQLPASVVNKIAAGEVIERPASVVKELLENSVDAGADRIEVAIENGGLDTIRVTDNGCGIPYEELQLAVTSHATSKIETADDLFRVASFGFRGEALASIAEVSEFTLRSRSQSQTEGYELIVRGGQSQSIEPVGCPVGTSIRVENLFYNTPVRRKFLRTGPTEAGHVTEAFTRIALAHPDRHLTLISGGKTSFELAPCPDWQTRIHDFFGSEISSGLIPIQSQDGSVALNGFVVDPSVSRSHNRMQYLFLNGRFIRDRSLQHALSEAYRGLLMGGRYPICFLRLDMPFELIDVNVHPAKLEVRFQDGGRLYSQLLSALRNRFLTTDLTARAQLARRSDEADVSRPISSAFGSVRGETAGTRSAGGGEYLLRSDAQDRQNQIPFPAAPPRNWVDTPWQRETTSVSPFSPRTSAPSGSSGDDSSAVSTPPDASSESGSHSNTAAPIAVVNSATATTPLPSIPINRVLALQVHDTYLIAETDEGVIVIDQHALHERILYEQLREKFESGKLETQQLLVPEPVSLRPTEVAVVLENADTLRKIGIAVEPFGGDTVAVTAYPAILANQNPAEMLRALIDPLLTEGARPQARDLIDDLLHMIACKAAIKAGDRLSRDEIASLLEHRGLCQDSHHCPHGRPTALVFSRDELDRRFKRI